MTPFQLKKTVVVDITGARIVSLFANLDDGTQINVIGPVTVGDMAIVDNQGVPGILAAADFEADCVGVKDAEAAPDNVKPKG